MNFLLLRCQRKENGVFPPENIFHASFLFVCCLGFMGYHFKPDPFLHLKTSFFCLRLGRVLHLPGVSHLLADRPQISCRRGGNNGEQTSICYFQCSRFLLVFSKRLVYILKNHGKLAKPNNLLQARYKIQT